MTSRRKPSPQPGVEGDWGKRRPFWCLTCGIGFFSIRLAWEHYETSGHTNESRSIGVKALTKEQQLEAFRIRNR
jgi:hypothetical protein